MSACLAVAVHAHAQEPSWRVSLGAGLDSVPKFPGADSQKVFALPFVAASYGPFFFGTYPGADRAAASLQCVSRYRFTPTPPMLPAPG